MSQYWVQSTPAFHWGTGGMRFLVRVPRCKTGTEDYQHSMNTLALYVGYGHLVQACQEEPSPFHVELVSASPAAAGVGSCGDVLPAVGILDTAETSSSICNTFLI